MKLETFCTFKKEKGSSLSSILLPLQITENKAAGAKARLDFIAFLARLKSCPGYKTLRVDLFVSSEAAVRRIQVRLPWASWAAEDGSAERCGLLSLVATAGTRGRTGSRCGGFRGESRRR